MKEMVCYQTLFFILLHSYSKVISFPLVCFRSVDVVSVQTRGVGQRTRSYTVMVKIVQSLYTKHATAS